jgi:hypothetical protein
MLFVFARTGMTANVDPGPAQSKSIDLKQVIAAIRTRSQRFGVTTRSEGFRHTVAKLIYWFGSFALAVLPLAMVATQFFTVPSGLTITHIYSQHYRDVLIVVMTFAGLAIFDCFELFRLLDSKVTLSYIAAVVLAMSIFFLFCIIVAQFSVQSMRLQLDLGGIRVPADDRLHLFFGSASLILAIAAKVWLSVLESASKKAPSGS